MTFGVLSFKCVLITGAAGGIGRAVADYFVSEGKKVILCGRTKSNLQTASKELNNAPYYVLDTGDMQAIPALVDQITREHPDLDCLINNAGVQRPLDVNEMAADELLEKADQEIDINIRGPLHLAIKLLPHFKQKPGAVIMNVSSVLGYIPFSVINPVYNGSKAWVHFWSMNLRTQLKQGGYENIKVVEIVPPTVSTALHRERNDPSDNSKEKNAEALSIDEFMQDIIRGWEQNKETISAGPGLRIVDRWFNEFGEDYSKKAERK